MPPRPPDVIAMLPARRPPGPGSLPVVSPAESTPPPTPADTSAARSGRRLVIKLTCGAERPEAANQAVTVAAAGVAAGAAVSLWLTGEASWFALPGRADELALPHAAPLTDLLAAVLAEGTVTLCTQCAARREITTGQVLEGIRIAGAPTFVEEVLAPGAQALVY